MLSKTDYQDDADSFSMMGGIGGFFLVIVIHLAMDILFSDAKGNNNTSDTTADATNAIGHGVSVGHGDFMFNEIISISTGLGYSISEAKDGTNDFETYDLSLSLNFAYHKHTLL